MAAEANSEATRNTSAAALLHGTVLPVFTPSRPAHDGLWQRAVSLTSAVITSGPLAASAPAATPPPGARGSLPSVV